MYGTAPLSGPGDGVFPPAVQHIRIRNGTAATTNAAFAAGSVVMLDVANGSTLATSFAPGHATSGADDSLFNVCILPTTAGIAAGYPILVCEEAIAVGAVGKATAMSPGVLAKIAVAGGDTARGAVLAPANNVDFFSSTVSATNATFFPAGAWLAQAAVSSTTATSASTTLVNVWLNGRFLG